MPEALQALQRQAALSGWSQSQLVEAFALNLQDTWLSRFTADERARYEAGTMDRAEVLEIRRRAALRKADAIAALAATRVDETISGLTNGRSGL